MSVREPAVAGMFYSFDAAALREEIETGFLEGPGTLPRVNPMGARRIAALVCPHAGLIYSGSVAAHAYCALADDGLPETIALIGPNHRSYTPPIALTDDRAWRTPFGEIELDGELIRELQQAIPGASVDPAAHRAEHSIEVQIPFIQYISESAGKSARIVPILIGSSISQHIADSGAERYIRELGNALGEALSGRDAVIIASTDFSHYERAKSAEAKDSRAISAILAMDEAELMRTVGEFDISMCGVLPTAVTIAASKALGAVAARKLAYANSGDVTGDYNEVVGYGALLLTKS